MKCIYMEMPKPGEFLNGVYASGQEIPNDRDNQVWREYLQFLNGGGQPLPFDPSMEWVNGEWVINTSKKAEQIANTKLEAFNTIDHFHAETVQQLVGNPTQVEKDTWSLKLEIANAITSKAPISSAGQSFLQSANITTGAAQADWATSVLAKSAAYATVVGLAEALRSTARAAVKAATDQASLDSALAAHRTAAEEAKASLAKRS